MEGKAGCHKLCNTTATSKGARWDVFAFDQHQHLGGTQDADMHPTNMDAYPFDAYPWICIQYFTSSFVNGLVDTSRGWRGRGLISGNVLSNALPANKGDHQGTTPGAEACMPMPCDRESSPGNQPGLLVRPVCKNRFF